MSEWDEKTENVSLEEMSAMIKHMREMQGKYDKANDIKKELGKDLNGLKDLIVQTLQAAKLKNFKVPGLGTAGIKTKYSVKVPVTVEDKKKVFKFIAKRCGQDVLDEYLCIKSGDLNDFYNAEAEIAASSGNEFDMPGVEEPTAKNSMAWYKDKDGNN